MAFNKIQPEQIQMPTFFSDSGGLNITQTNTGIQINLSQNLTGNYAFTGSVLIDGKGVFGLANTGNNSFDVTSGNVLLMGSNTEIGQDSNNGYNVCVFADSSSVSGINNSILNGLNITFRTGTLRNTALAGNNIIFQKTATGSVGLKDTLASSTLSIENPQSFYANFASGHFFEEGKTYFGSSISSNASGIFSGDIEILGSGILTGYAVVNTHYLTGYTSGNFVNRCGDEAITGQKTIVDCMRFQTGFQLPAYTGTVQGAGTATVPATGALAISGHTLYINVGDAWAGIAISGSL